MRVCGVVEPVHGCDCLHDILDTETDIDICQTNRQESGAAFAALTQRLRSRLGL